MEKKFAKVGDKIRIVEAYNTNHFYNNGDVLEVARVESGWRGVDVVLPSGQLYHVHHFEYEIVEDRQEDDFVFTEEHVGMEVWDIQQGRGKIYEFDVDELYAVSVEFENDSDYTYTKDGKMFVHHKLRQLYFSEPTVTIEAELFPPKKKFVPTFKKGETVVAKKKDGSRTVVFYVDKETELSVESTGCGYPKALYSFYKIGEEVKFEEN